MDVIKIDDHRGAGAKKILDRFDIDMGGCIECALCVEACPFRAIVMAPDFEFGAYDREKSLVFNMHELRIAGTPEVDSAILRLRRRPTPIPISKPASNGFLAVAIVRTPWLCWTFPIPRDLFTPRCAAMI